MSFTPIGPPVIHNIYCSAQGPHAPPAEDHLRSVLVSNFEETGEPDEHGGRCLVTVAGGANEALGVPPGVKIICRICGAPLRRFEVKWKETV